MEPLTDFQRNLCAKLLATGVETNITQRWEQGTDHHPKAVEIVKVLKALDWLFGGDYLCIKTGGDGDNGEHMIYLLDIYFEMKERNWVDA